jgi:hypothetical protein
MFAFVAKVFSFHIEKIIEKFGTKMDIDFFVVFIDTIMKLIQHQNNKSANQRCFALLLQKPNPIMKKSSYQFLFLQFVINQTKMKLLFGNGANFN